MKRLQTFLYMGLFVVRNLQNDGLLICDQVIAAYRLIAWSLRSVWDILP